jgi:WD40 repeat protein
LDPPAVQNPQQALANQLAFSGDGRQIISLHGQAEIHARDATTGQLLRKFSGQGEFRLFALTPDGKLLAVPNVIQGDAKTVVKVLLWETGTGKALPEFLVATLEGNVNVFLGLGVAGIRCLALSPDGKYGAAGQEGGGIRLWELATGKEIRRFEGHRTGVARVAFSRNSKTLASIGPDEFIHLWDVASGEQIKSWQAPGLRRLQQFETQSQGLAFMHGGKWLALNGRGQVRVWDVNSGEPVPIHGPDLQAVPGAPIEGRVFQVLSPGGKVLATAQQGEQQQGTRLRLHDPATGADLHQFARHEGPIQSVAISAHNVVATGGADRTVRLWDGETGMQLKVLRGHVGPVNYLAFSPDGQRLASGGQEDRVISVWDVASGKEIRQFRWGTGPFGRRGLVFLAGGKELMALGVETVWDIATGKQLRELEDANAFRVSSALTADGRLMASSRLSFPKGGNAGMAKVLFVLSEPRSGKEVASFDAPGAEGARFVTQLALAPSGQTMLAREGDRNEFVLFDPASGRALRVLPRPGGLGGDGFFGSTKRPFFTPDGRLLIHAGHQSKVHVMELASGQDRQTIEAAQSGLTALTISPDGKTLVTGGNDGTALLWDLAAAGPAGSKTSFSEKELALLWTNMGGDAPKAGQAIADLAAMPVQAVPFLSGQVTPAVKPDLARIEKLIKDLDSENFQARKTSETELDKAGFAAKPFLEKALKSKPSLDMARRIETMLTKLETMPLPPETVRQLRALEVLEEIGSPLARQLIEKLASGAPGEPLTVEARSALERLKRRAG